MKAVLLLAAVLVAPTASARPVLVEMFVSQSCSSCPPANALLQSLAATDKGILPLSLDVTYWNYLSWHDTDSSDAATARQYWYAKLSGSDVYTPEAVVDGGAQLVGSDRGALTQAIMAARAAPAANVPIGIWGGATLRVTVGAGTGAAQVILFGYDDRHDTHVAAGENGGAVISEINVVREFAPIGAWHGKAAVFTVTRPAGQHVAVLLQAESGAVLGLSAL